MYSGVVALNADLEMEIEVEIEDGAWESDTAESRTTSSLSDRNR